MPVERADMPGADMGARKLAQEIAAFIFTEDVPEPADVILVCGSASTEPAKRAAQLYHDGFSRYVLPTGRFGERFSDFRSEIRKFAGNNGQDPEKLLSEIEAQAAAVGNPFPETEWAYQRDALLFAGVPEEAILREDRSMNTFQNAVFARRVLEEKGIPTDRLILCCQAYHARRASMTIATEFPASRIIVCPAVTRGISRDAWEHSAAGYDKVLDELQKCGAYFRGERMYRAFAEQLPASEIEAGSAG